MRKYTVLFCILFLFVIEAAALAVYALDTPNFLQDTVAVNEIIQSVQSGWENIESHKTSENLDYTVLDKSGSLLYQTRTGLSETINAAVAHRDTILNIQNDNAVIGTLILWNDSVEIFQQKKKNISFILILCILIQSGFCAVYFLFLHRIMIKPFHKLGSFAERVAQGNLDIPLDMDRQNIFGSFTESFDLMRSELKKARLAEARANMEKKELTAKLSHDIKTPVASILAAAEVGCAITANERTRENYRRIIQKAEQINTLITNLFTAALDDLGHLSVTPADIESREIQTILENADYLHRAAIPIVPGCILHADKLRLQQVFDNIFANSYKYANTNINVSVYKDSKHLYICIEDYGKGIAAEELPVLKEKYTRGSNAKNIEGAGLGLYISNGFMKEMQGELLLENGKNGLKVTVKIVLSGSLV